jgi:uncharacterized protein YeaO (DUF488 family)
MAILLKSAREAASPEDGARVLVERRRPGRVRKDSLELRACFAVLAPSEELRRWFDERPRQWLLFRRRYLAELCTEKAAAALSQLHAIAASEPTLTLLTLDEEPERSHAAILRDLLQGTRKPPSSTGPARAASGRVRAGRPR